jgi:hypothetical protein
MITLKAETYVKQGALNTSGGLALKEIIRNCGMMHKEFWNMVWV